MRIQVDWSARSLAPRPSQSPCCPHPRGVVHGFLQCLLSFVSGRVSSSHHCRSARPQKGRLRMRRPVPSEVPAMWTFTICRGLRALPQACSLSFAFRSAIDVDAWDWDTCPLTQPSLKFRPPPAEIKIEDTVGDEDEAGRNRQRWYNKAIFAAPPAEEFAPVIQDMANVPDLFAKAKVTCMRCQVAIPPKSGRARSSVPPSAWTG
jgi:hypothetical protein